MTTSRGLAGVERAYHYLPSLSDPSQPLVPSDEQARFVLECYRTDAAGWPIAWPRSAR